MPSTEIALTFMSSVRQDVKMMKIACAEGGPMYCLISALSMNARSIASVMFDVARINTLGFLEEKT